MPVFLLLFPLQRSKKVLQFSSKFVNLGVDPEGSDVSGGDVANQKIHLRDGEHSLLLVEDQAAGCEDGGQCAEVRPVPLSGFC